MFRSYWIAAIALGLTVSFSSLAEEVMSQHPIEPIATQEQAAEKARIEARLMATTITPAEPTATEHNQSTAPDSNSATNDHLFYGDGFARWLMTVTGIGALILSVWAVWLLKKTLDATRDAVGQTAASTAAALKSIDTTERIGEAQVRAYLSCVRGEYAVEFSAQHFRCTLVAKNNGQSPATDISATYDLTFADVDEMGHEGPTPRISGITPLGAVDPIPAGVEGEIPLNMSMLDISERSDSFTSRIGKIDFPFWIFGKLSWKDVFGKLQTIDFTLTSGDMPNGDTPGTLSAANRHR